jgi:hypothetical protein
MDESSLLRPGRFTAGMGTEKRGTALKKRLGGPARAAFQVAIDARVMAEAMFHEGDGRPHQRDEPSSDPIPGTTLC